MSINQRLIVVSNRLPVTLKHSEEGWAVSPGSGGLVSALGPILKDRGGKWIGWIGTSDTIPIKGVKTLLGPASEQSGYRLYPVLLEKEDIEKFYMGFSNEIIWPLFHDLQTKCNFIPEYWRSYLTVNEKYAKVLAKHTLENDYVWIHDYHLIPLAGIMKRMGHQRKCVFFLHIPFPPEDIFLKLPWRNALLRSFFDYDFVGFQTARDRRNFIECVKAIFPETNFQGRGPVMHAEMEGRKIGLGSLPISIDYKSFNDIASQKQTHEEARTIKQSYSTEHLLLGVDRLDYTKGILERLKAFQQALSFNSDMIGNTTFLQLVVPSRDEVPAYSDLKQKIETLVSQINGEFTRKGWIPVVYMYQSMPREHLIAHYLAADIGLVTPLKDGMNLVCKEYCASHVDNRGVLILSEFAGAAVQLRENALLVNPYDTEGMAASICYATKMPLYEQKKRMTKLRHKIKEQDVFWWLDNFLRGSLGKELSDFPESNMAPLQG